MSRTYVTIVSESGKGAYDFAWHFAIQAKRDGSRFRIVSGGFRWTGNTGTSRDDAPAYLDRNAGRNALRAYRAAKAENLKGNWGPTPRDAAVSAAS